MAEFSCRLDSSTSRSRSPGALCATQIFAELGDCGRGAREQRRVRHAAARLNQLRRRHVRRR